MEHDAAIRQHMTEKYLLNELDAPARDEFEEHFFDCEDCALDVRAGATFVAQAKSELAEKSKLLAPVVYAPRPTSPSLSWFAWLRPSFALPAMVLLLVVIGYQNLVTYPHMLKVMDNPHLLPWASVNVGTWGSNGPVISVRPGEGFMLFVRIPPEATYATYVIELFNPVGTKEWSLSIPGSTVQDQWPVEVPAADRAAGNYSLLVRGVTNDGQKVEVGKSSFELQLQR